MNIQVQTKRCPGCGGAKELSVDRDDYREWKNGTLIQKAMPYLNTDDRERLITGYCPGCWDKLFKEK